MKAVLRDDCDSFEMVGDGYHDLRPLSALGHTLEFYRALRDRKHGAYSRHYSETVSNLEAVQAEARTKGLL